MWSPTWLVSLVKHTVFTKWSCRPLHLCRVHYWNIKTKQVQLLGYVFCIDCIFNPSVVDHVSEILLPLFLKILTLFSMLLMLFFKRFCHFFQCFFKFLVNKPNLNYILPHLFCLLFRLITIFSLKIKLVKIRGCWGNHSLCLRMLYGFHTMFIHTSKLTLGNLVERNPYFGYKQLWKGVKFDPRTTKGLKTSLTATQTPKLGSNIRDRPWRIQQLK